MARLHLASVTTGALMLCLASGFDWPGERERIVATLTHAADAREAQQALRRLGALLPPHDAAVLAVLAPWRNAPEPALRAEALHQLGRRGRCEESALEAGLADPEATVRAAAAEACGEQTSPAARAALRHGLRDAAASVRVATARALAAEPDADDLHALARALEDAAIEVRVEAARTLGQHVGDSARDLLVAHAASPVPELRAAVVELLGARAGPEPEQAVVCALGDDDEAVVLASLRALRRARSAGRALPRAALEALRDARSTQVARAAADLLQSEAPSRAPTDPPAWLALLEQTADPALSAGEAQRLVEALTHALPPGEERAADPLVLWLATAPRALLPRIVALFPRTEAPLDAAPILRALPGSPPEARAGLTRLLGRGASEVVRAPLLALLDDPKRPVREAAADALARHLDDALLDALAAKLTQRPPPRSTAALRALADGLAQRAPTLATGRTEALTGDLVRVLQDRDEPDAALAARALGAIATPRARDALHALAYDARPRRRVAALRALVTDRSERARTLRATLCRDDDARVAATALIASALAGDAVASESLLPQLGSDTPWPRGVAAAFALTRVPLSAHDGVALCAALATPDPITRMNLQRARARLLDAPDCEPARAPRGSDAASERLRGAVFRPAPLSERALVLDDTSVIVSVPDASGSAQWPGLAAHAEVSPWAAAYTHR